MAKEKKESKQEKLTDQQIRANIITLGGHVKNFDYLIMHFIQFLGKEEEFKKYMVNIQLEAKKNAEKKEKNN